MKKIITALSITVIILIAWNIHSCNKTKAQDVEINRITEQSTEKIEMAELRADAAIQKAEKYRKEAEAHKEGMESAESDAAELNKLIVAERLGRQEIQKQLDIIMSDPPCKNLDFENLDFEKAKLKIISLCKIGEHQEKLRLSLEYDIEQLEGTISKKNKALSSCKSMANKFESEAKEYKKAATERLNSIDEYKNIIVPGLKKKIRNHKRRKFWQKMRDYLIGAAFGAAGIAILK